MSPVLGRPPRARRSHPKKPGAQALGVGKGTTASGRQTGAQEQPHQTRCGALRGATRHAREACCRPQPRHTDRFQATMAAGCRKPREQAQHATNRGTRRGAKQHQPPSGWTCARAAASPAPAGYETAAIRMDECAPGGYPAPAGYETATVRMDECAPCSDAPHTQHHTRNLRHNTPSEHTGEQEPSGPGHRTPNTAHRASTPVNKSQGARTPYAQHNTASGHTGEQEPSGPGHRTPNTAHRAATPVNSSQVAQDTAHPTQNQASTPVNRSQGAQDTANATQNTELARWCTGAKGLRTPHTQSNAPSRHTGEQEPSSPGHRRRYTTNRAGTPVNRSQGAQDTANATQDTERARWCTGAKGLRTPHTQSNAPSRHTGEQEPSSPGHRRRYTTNRPGTPVNRSPVAQDTANAKQHTKRAHR